MIDFEGLVCEYGICQKQHAEHLEDLMRFYRAVCTAEDHNVRGLASATTWKEVGKDLVLFPYTQRGFGGDDSFFVGVISARNDLTREALSGIIRRVCEDDWDIADLESINSVECTFNKCTDQVGATALYSSDIVSRAARLLHAEELFTLLMRTKVFWEYTIKDAIPAGGLLGAAQKTIYSEALSQEIERVVACVPEAGHAHHILPVHYLVEGNNPNDYQPAIDVLLESLYENNRLVSSHAYVFEVDKLGRSEWARGAAANEDNFMALINGALGDALKSSSIIVKYGQDDDGSNFNKFAYQALTKLIDELSERGDEIQVVFVVPEGSGDLQVRIKNRFRLPLIRIVPDEAPKAFDLTEDEAHAILVRRAEADSLEPDDELRRILHRRMEDRSFSNLDEVYDEWSKLTLTRSVFPQYLSIVQAAYDSDGAAAPVDARKRLEEMIGLAGVKRQIEDVLLRFKMNKEAAFAGLKPQPFSMHLAFQGAPGTGKTEVARLYAEILKDEGILSEGRLIMRSGTGAWNVQEAFAEAKGSVLFVDEAYAMASTSDGRIADFIACMENYRRDTVVILAGYKNSINRLIDCNPGFRSRISFFIDFPDYSQEEKMQIFQLMVDRAGLTMAEEARSAARDILARGGTQADEGNGRFVRNLFESAIGQQQRRLSRQKPEGGYTKELLAELREEDIVAAGKRESVHQLSGREELAGLIGLAEIKQLVSDRMDYMKVQKAKRDAGIKAPFIPMHMAFKGNPGTGKTEVARLIARILREEGVLSVGECKEYIGADLWNTLAINLAFEDAKGSVLFVDEAYSIPKNAEATAALVACMENYREDVIVVFAGYTREVDQLLSANPGFASRVKFHLEFADYTEDELLQILNLLAGKMHVTLGEGVPEKVRGFVREARKESRFGNGRFVRNVLEDAIVAQGARLVREHSALGGLDSDVLTRLEAEDFSWQPKRLEDAPASVGFTA
ncbi:AAA family ATPase [Parvibacter caecicola]|uniref:AAA family ATPase n=1 Tax=Parvibacter caecicola TaxID=747645 RepID=UPI0023F19CCA|nr:AAA family ATPase [Parvibacter caecicola]